MSKADKIFDSCDKENFRFTIECSGVHDVLVKSANVDRNELTIFGGLIVTGMDFKVTVLDEKLEPTDEVYYSKAKGPIKIRYDMPIPVATAV